MTGDAGGGGQTERDDDIRRSNRVSVCMSHNI